VDRAPSQVCLEQEVGVGEEVSTVSKWSEPHHQTTMAKGSWA